MGMSLRGVLGRIDRLASRLQQSRAERWPDVGSMTTAELETELLTHYEASAGRPFETFASPEEFVDAMRARRFSTTIASVTTHPPSASPTEVPVSVESVRTGRSPAGPALRACAGRSRGWRTPRAGCGGR